MQKKRYCANPRPDSNESTASHASEKKYTPDPSLPQWVNEMNTGFVENPYAMLGVIFGADVITAISCAGLAQVFNLSASPELVIAMLIRKGLPFIFGPLQLAFITGMNRVWPSLTKVRVDAAMPSMRKISPRLSAGVRKYGLGMIWGLRLSAVLATLAVYYSMRLGVDWSVVTEWANQTFGWELNPTDLTEDSTIASSLAGFLAAGVLLPFATIGGVKGFLAWRKVMHGAK